MAVVLQVQQVDLRVWQDDDGHDGGGQRCWRC